MKILKFKKIDSTQKKAKELAQKGENPWLIILAEEQATGAGKVGSAWYSPKGGLYFSIALPKSKIEDLQTLTILAAFITAKVIKDNFGLEPFIKLPNDVWLNGKKVCGILTENVIGPAKDKCPDVKMSVMGIGLNTNIEKFPEELKNIATSLKIELDKDIDNKKILKQIIEGLKEQLKTIS